MKILKVFSKLEQQGSGIGHITVKYLGGGGPQYMDKNHLQIQEGGLNL